MDVFKEIIRLSEYLGIVCKKLYHVLSSPYRNNPRVSTLLRKKSLNLKKTCLKRKQHKMAALKLQRLRELIKYSYEAGYNGCMELVEEFTDELMNEIQLEIKSLKNSTDEWRIYTIEELKKKPLGTTFKHSRLGRCWIDGRTEKGKCMVFENGEQIYFMQQVSPWDEVMLELNHILQGKTS